jgi:hypothetical protein
MVLTIGNILLRKKIDNAQNEQVADSENSLFTSDYDSGVSDENLFKKRLP